MSADVTRGSEFNTEVTMSGLVFEGFGEDAKKVSFCAADAAQIWDVVLEDLDGSLDPNSDTTTGSGGGFVLSSDAKLIGGECTVLEESCAHFCTSVVAAAPGALPLYENERVAGSNGGSIIAGVGGTGGTADASGSTGGTSSSSSSPSCLTNPDFELGSEGWRAVQTAGGIAMVPGFNSNGNALKVYDRLLSATGSAWQDIQTSCMTAYVWYEISTDVKMTTKGTTEDVFECNPSNMWHIGAKSCAGITLF